MKKFQPSVFKVIDLFAGCGGLSLGFENAGFSLVAAFDNWLPAIEVYKTNFAHSVFNCNLENLNKDFTLFKEFNPNIIIGGPPCQDFSSAGKRNENLGRGDLTILFAEIVANVKPQWFVMENVERLARTNKYKIAREMFKGAEYGITSTVLDASLCGVPQKRKRFFCIGELGGEDNSLLCYLRAKLAKKAMTVRDYMGDSLEINYYYRHPRSYKRRAIFSIDEPSPTIRGVNRPIPKTYTFHPKDAAPLLPELRPLTTIERSYIQTFPRDFVFKGTKTNLEQMIGNAVPVKLAEYVAQCIIKYIQEQGQESRAVYTSEARQLCLPITL